ncbi:MAG: chorismate mutase [Patescibacteria group bacterium]
MELEEIRKKLDTIDENILNLIAERIFYAPQIAEYKKKNNLPIYDAKREKQIIESKKMLAEKLGIDGEFVEKIFTILMEASRKEQEK